MLSFQLLIKPYT